MKKPEFRTYFAPFNSEGFINFEEMDLYLGFWNLRIKLKTISKRIQNNFLKIERSMPNCLKPTQYILDDIFVRFWNSVMYDRFHDELNDPLKNFSLLIGS